ncbi:MAG: hypothetical protein JWQ25_332, partial [Daejeonella sp.]|nr:hypothetical protein [Daejeonella sp.]
MKIAFICGCLEPGRDGVGDYVRQLCAELIRKGINVYIISINDYHLAEVCEEPQYVDELKLLVYRISASLPVKKRFSAAKEQIEKFNPDWVSVQYVPYAFHSYGLPFLFSQRLKQILKNRKVHFMFHETWIGTENNDKLRSIIISVLQQVVIKGMLHSLKPLALHASLPQNYKRLKNLGFIIKPLPLFSNISVYSEEIDKQFNTVVRIGIFSQVD